MRHLHLLIQLDEREQYLTSIQGPELTRLVEFLGEVPILPSAPCLVIKQALQTLNILSTHDAVSQQCLHKLQAVCAHRGTLPRSYIVSGDFTRVGRHPTKHFLGGIVEVWEGTCRHRRVSVNCLKVPLNGDQVLQKVCIWCSTSLSRLLKNTCGPVVILQRGRYLEKVKAPEHRPFHRRYNKSSANHLGMDAERNSGDVHQEKPRREAD